jgi:kumamolisin
LQNLKKGIYMQNRFSLLLLGLSLSVQPVTAMTKETHFNTIHPTVLIPKKSIATALPTAETPASIACLYGLTPAVPGCPIATTTAVPNGGLGATIVVTEGGHDPNALVEVNTFSQQYNLPQFTCSGINPCFQQQYATTGNMQPPNATGNDLVEHVIDLEWAHAMAPYANIIMVETYSFSQPDIFYAVQLGNQLLQQIGGGIMSNSWGAREYSGETANDSLFQTPGVIYLVSSGDNYAPGSYPSSSPYVISAGGTGINRDANGNFISEVWWNSPGIGKGGSGGPSLYESRPAFQNSVAKIVGNTRGTPDISSVATNVSIYLIDEFSQPLWGSAYGTSIAAPTLAGIIASANSGARSSAQELTIIYTGALKNYHSYWHDIISGNNGYPSLQGYDFTTGLGSVLTYKGK